MGEYKERSEGKRERWVDKERDRGKDIHEEKESK